MDDVFWHIYRFEVHDFADQWKDVGGIYIFSGPDRQGQCWEPLYVGETGSFRDRIPCHERWLEAVGLGATHVHAMVAPLAEMRAAVERELIAGYQPPLNLRLRSLADLFQPLPGFVLSR